MLGAKYPGEDADVDTIKSMLLQLSKLGSKNVVITGVKTNPGQLGFVGYNSNEDSFFCYSTKEVPIKSHGTGDDFCQHLPPVLNERLLYIWSFKNCCGFHLQVYTK